jgi:hypothetical protein
VSDPTSASEHKDKMEAQEAVRMALRMVEEADSSHYELLAKSCELTGVPANRKVTSTYLHKSE